MFFVFFFLTKSIYWEFDVNEFDALKKNSTKTPIFLVATSRLCNHCNGIQESTKEFATKGFGQRDDVIITVVDCASPQHICKKMKIESTPSMFLIIGEDQNYWPQTKNKSTDSWNTFLNEYLNSNFNEIHSISEIPSSDKYNPFILKTKSNETKEFNEIRNFSRYYKIFNCTFYYIIDKELETFQFMVHTSANCSQLYDHQQETLKDFVERNKFGPMHSYSFKEYQNINSSRFGLILVETPYLLDMQKEALLSFNDYYCNKISFGFSNDNELSQYLGVISNDRPALVYKLPGCLAKTKERLLDAIQAGFFESAENNKTCSNSYFLGVPPENTIPGLHIVFIYYVIGLSLILILRSDNSQDTVEKIE